MPRRAVLTEGQRDALLALPDTELDLVRHWTLSADDLRVIVRRRRPHNRLGFRFAPRIPNLAARRLHLFEGLDPGPDIAPPAQAALASNATTPSNRRATRSCGEAASAASIAARFSRRLAGVIVPDVEVATVFVGTAGAVAAV